MGNNFWQQLVSKGPIVGLSPMDGVTDLPMRYMSAKYGRPQVIYTEFVSVDGLKHAKNREAVGRLMAPFLKLEEIGGLEQYPFQVAQVFGNEPELFYQAAVIVATLGYDGMDINMGCPAKNVSERGSGAGLIRTPVIAQEIVRQARRAMSEFAEGRVTIDELEVSEAVKEWVKGHAKPRAGYELPVSVKTRIGVDSVVVEEWMKSLMEVNPAMITLHGRTLKQLYQGQADWEAIGRAAQVVHQMGGHILGNGDVETVEDGMLKVEKYGVDGFLIGRAAEGNPGVFAGKDNPSIDERKAWMLEHTKLFEQVFGLDHFVPMRKHLAWYCKGFPGASELREKLVRMMSCGEIETVFLDLKSC